MRSIGNRLNTARLPFAVSLSNRLAGARVRSPMPPLGPLQLAAYHTAIARGTHEGWPRNPANASMLE